MTSPGGETTRADEPRHPPDTPDPVRLFRDALPGHISARLHPTERATAFIHAAVRRGWTIPALATECTRSLGGVVNPGGVITSRLEHCSQHDPPVKPSVTFTQPRPWCHQCSDPHARWALNATRPNQRCECWTDPKADKR